MKLETAIKYMNAAPAAIDPALLNREVGSFAIDSREIEPGGLFFALSQPEYRNNCFNGDFEDSIIKDENFMAGIKQISELKLRASYGKVGNTAVA